MCILFLALGICEEFPVIIATSRDEETNRAAEIAHFWNTEGKKVIGGIDLRAGGTWLAASTHGRIGIILNCVQRFDISDNFLSRGEIVSQYVLDATSAEEFTASLVGNGNFYKPFNFVALQYFCEEKSAQSFVVTKPGTLEPARRCQLTIGSHVIGNLPYGADGSLKKMVHGKALFDDTLSSFAKSEKRDFETLQKMLVNKVMTDSTLCFPDSELERVWKTEHAPFLSSVAKVFVCIPSVYQTRCSTVIAVDKIGMCHFIEHTWAVMSSWDASLPTPTHVTRESFQFVN